MDDVHYVIISLRTLHTVYMIRICIR